MSREVDYEFPDRKGTISSDNRKEIKNLPAGLRGDNKDKCLVLSCSLISLRTFLKVSLLSSLYILMIQRCTRQSEIKKM